MQPAPRLAPAGATFTPGWLIPVTENIPALVHCNSTWYAALHQGNSIVEDSAYEALYWLLGVSGCKCLIGTPHPDIFSDAVLLVPSTDTLAVALADTAAGLFFLTGAFTQDQAEAFIGLSVEQLLLLAIAVPDNVIAPAQEATSARGQVAQGGIVWVWQQVAGSYPSEQEEARQGMLRASTQEDALARLREGVPEAGLCEWIRRQQYRYPLGLRAARV